MATHSFTIVLRGEGKQRLIPDDADVAELERRIRQAVRDSGVLPDGVEVYEPPALPAPASPPALPAGPDDDGQPALPAGPPAPPPLIG